MSKSPCSSRATYSWLLMATFSRFFSISKDRDSTSCLRDVCQCLATLTVKTHFWCPEGSSRDSVSAHVFPPGHFPGSHSTWCPSRTPRSLSGFSPGSPSTSWCLGLFLLRCKTLAFLLLTFRRFPACGGPCGQQHNPLVCHPPLLVWHYQQCWGYTQSHHPHC